MKEKSKNKIFFPNLILLALGLLVIVYSVFNIVSLGLIKKQPTAVLNSLSNEYYVVGKDPTALQKDTFNLLTEELGNTSRDYEKITDLVAQSFVIDFFNWSNKDASFDVGGLQYVYNPKVFNSIAHFEYYQKVDMFNSTYGKNNLPQVTDVKSKISKTTDYIIDDKVFSAYKADMSWDYAKSSKLDVSEFVNECELTLINDDGMIKIVEVKMIDENSSEVDGDE